MTNCLVCMQACGEIERCRTVYKFGLQSLLPKQMSKEEGASSPQVAAAVAVAAAKGQSTPAGRAAAAYSRLYDEYTSFERRRGDKGAVEEVSIPFFIFMFTHCFFSFLLFIE